LDYLITICEALEFVYRNSVVHRDIKPANIMITNSGIIKLVDFGVAWARGAKTTGFEKGVIMGTPLYMSPEQVAGLALDHRSDMYSLGATFYHAFCGSPPFESDDYKRILDQHLNTPLVPLKDRNTKTDATLCRIIEKMLAKDPNDRLKNFQAVVKELKALRSRVSSK
jgi:serine/threonine-protein kinase